MESESSHTIEMDRKVDQRADRKLKGHFKEASEKLKNLPPVKIVHNVFSDFISFIDKGNVVDLAVAFVLSAAFTAIVTSAVNDLFTPLISLALDSTSLDNLYQLLACPKGFGGVSNSTRPPLSACKTESTVVWTTVALANNAGAIVWSYGSFLQKILSFFIIAMIVFFLVKAYTATFRRKVPKKVKDCHECCKEIPLAATRCAFCTSLVEE